MAHSSSGGFRQQPDPQASLQGGYPSSRAMAQKGHATGDDGLARLAAAPARRTKSVSTARATCCIAERDLPLSSVPDEAPHGPHFDLSPARVRRRHGGDQVPRPRRNLRQPHSIALDGDGQSLYLRHPEQPRRAAAMRPAESSRPLPAMAKRRTRQTVRRSARPCAVPAPSISGRMGRLYLILREGNKVLRIDPKALNAEPDRRYRCQRLFRRWRARPRFNLNGPKGIAYAPDGSLYIAGHGKSCDPQSLAAR